MDGLSKLADIVLSKLQRADHSAFKESIFERYALIISFPIFL
jgi:hypothetical protein